MGQKEPNILSLLTLNQRMACIRQEAKSECRPRTLARIMTTQHVNGTCTWHVNQQHACSACNMAIGAALLLKSETLPQTIACRPAKGRSWSNMLKAM